MDEPRFPSRGRGRVPDPQRVAQTRETILRSALTTFLERGFEGTRMADVAAGAGLAKGTLYLHFADKEALFEFVLQNIVSEPLARLRATEGPQGEGVRARIERIMMPALRDMESSGRAAVLRLIVAEGSRFPAIAEMHRRLVIGPMMAAMEAALASGGEHPALEPLRRYPQVLGAPVVMAAVWNGLWCSGEAIDAAAMYTAFLDAVFGARPG